MRQVHASLSFSDVERIDLLKAWLAISLAFGIFFLGGGGFSNITFSSFVFIVGIAAVTAGAGFILHELCHKIAAHHFGVHSEFRSDDVMLVVAIFIAFLGVIFAAPGAVLIFGQISRRENGIISAAGPLANMVLALVFLPFVLLFPADSLLHILGGYGFFINAMLGAFNLIPLGNFDGAKILRWDKRVYFLMLVFGVGLVVASFLVTGVA